MQLGGQPQGRGFFQQLGAHQQVGGEFLAEFNRFDSRGYSCRHVAILAKALGKNCPQSGVGIDHQHPLGMAAVVISIRLSHGRGWQLLVQSKSN
jgi:hypothetical protein